MSDLRETAATERIIRTSWGSVSILLDSPWCIACRYFDGLPAGRDSFFCRTTLDVEGERVPVFDLDSLCRNLFAVKSDFSFPAAVFASTSGMRPDQLKILSEHLKMLPEHLKILPDHLSTGDCQFSAKYIAFRLSGETGLKVLPRSRRKPVPGAVGVLYSQTGIRGVSFEDGGIDWYVDPFELLMRAVTPDGET